MGRYATKRAWVSKCRYCAMPIFYWESVAGHKVIFNYPIYDRLQKHICDKYYQEMQSKIKPRIPKYIRPEPERKNPLDVDEFELYTCPVCSKAFRAEDMLNDHIKTMKKTDEDHEIFFDKVLDMINFDFDDGKSNENHEDKGEEIPNKSDNDVESNPKQYRMNQNIKVNTVFGKVVYRNKNKK